jgi:acyl carrier protein
MSIDDDEVCQKIKEIMSSLFDLSPEEINDHSSPRTIPSWKGKNHLKMVELLEDEFSIKIEPEEIETLVSYKVVRATVMAYLL